MEAGGGPCVSQTTHVETMQSFVGVTSHVNRQAGCCTCERKLGGEESTVAAEQTGRILAFKQNAGVPLMILPRRRLNEQTGVVGGRVVKRAR